MTPQDKGVRRWHIGTQYDHDGTPETYEVETLSGRWVQYAEVERLEAEIARLRALADAISRDSNACALERTAQFLRAEYFHAAMADLPAPTEEHMAEAAEAALSRVAALAGKWEAVGLGGCCDDTERQCATDLRAALLPPGAGKR